MAKKLLIGHQSALLVYRAAGSGLMERPPSAAGEITSFDCTTRLRDFFDSSNVRALAESRQVDLLAMSDNMKHRSSSIRIHRSKGVFPAGSFNQLGRDVLVASPELTFLQSCQDLHNQTSRQEMGWCKDLIDVFGDLGMYVAAAEICSELCGLYSIVPDGSSDMSRHRCFTDMTKMQLMLSRLSHRPHVRFARRAASMGSPCSASPRETSVYLVMTSPWPIGYGFEYPSANQLITIGDSPIATDDDCAQIRFSDYRWSGRVLKNGRRRRSVTLEYDSDKYHTMMAGLTDQQLWEQAERRDLIESSGNQYLRLTTKHTKDFDLFDEKMRQLAALLRIDLPDRTADEEDLARQFQQLLFDTERFKHVGTFSTNEKD